MPKLGIYGGTFDPIHLGHLHVVTSLLQEKTVDRILVIPAGEPRLREYAPVASAADRRAMCQAALADLPHEIASRVEVNPIEVLRIGPSYTIDTVEAIEQAFPEYELALILGTDAYNKIDQWHRADELKKKVEFIVIDRPEHPGQATHKIGALKVSATSIRSGASRDTSPAVTAYIKEHNLYASK